MINIRTITYNLPKKLNSKIFDTIHNCIESWKDFDYFVRTVRISTYPIENSEANDFEQINDFCINHNIRWFSIPVRIKEDSLVSYSYSLLKKYDRAFVNIEGAKDNIMFFGSIDKYIKLMKKVGKLSLDGNDNFRLGLSINIKDNTPFFPFAQSSGENSFSIGLELTEEINEIISKYNNLNLDEMRKKIIKKIDSQITEIEKYAIQIEEKYHIKFCGFDFSLAPTLQKNGSIISLIQKIGVKDFSGSGIMFATAYLTNILKSFGNKHRHVGFSGVMYSLLEDNKLCEINNNQGVHLEDIIKLSTMCGCGIDMVPIYENTNNDIIKSYILDICAISCRLNKPLGIRFLSLNQKLKMTNFSKDSDFIANTKILNLNTNKVKGKDINNFNFIKLK